MNFSNIIIRKKKERDDHRYYIYIYIKEMRIGVTSYTQNKSSNHCALYENITHPKPLSVIQPHLHF